MTNAVDMPDDRRKALIVARCRWLGFTQKDAADAAGVTRRTVIRWEHSDWWPDIVTEAERHGMSEMVARARGTLIEALKRGDDKVARWVLERRDQMFRPPAQQVDVNHTAHMPDLSELSTEELRALAEKHAPKAIEAKAEVIDNDG